MRLSVRASSCPERRDKAMVRMSISWLRCCRLTVDHQHNFSGATPHNRRQYSDLSQLILTDMSDLLNALHYHPPQIPWLDIRYIDRDIIVINKPSGILTSPGGGIAKQDSIWKRVLERFPLSQVVHRLDQATSGVLVLALRRKAEKALKRQFMERGVTKRYVARVAGVVEAESGIIDLALANDPNRPPLQKVSQSDGKPSQTEYLVLSRNNDTTLVALHPITGRSHQLRVHMLAMGHPILGDQFYAPDTIKNASSRLLLHAESISFLHPYSGEPVTFEVSSGSRFLIPRSINSEILQSLWPVAPGKPGADNAHADGRPDLASGK